jgi:hypothetical protein
MTSIRIGSRRFSLPASRIARTLIGVLLIGAGLLGFLPVLGFWMIPLGLLVLSVDFPLVRRWRRRWTVAFGDWLMRRYPGLARSLGFNHDGKRTAHRGAAKSASRQRDRA